ncbi:hypothetical protein ABQE44_16305 [Mycolicibacterium sp. XJ2546]
MNSRHSTKRAARWALAAVAAAAAAGAAQFISTAIAAADDSTDPGSETFASSDFDMTPIDPPSATFTPSEQSTGDFTGGSGDLVGVPNGPISVGRAPFTFTEPEVVVWFEDPGADSGPGVAPNLGEFYEVLPDDAGW